MLRTHQSAGAHLEHDSPSRSVQIRTSDSAAHVSMPPLAPASTMTPTNSAPMSGTTTATASTTSVPLGQIAPAPTNPVSASSSLASAPTVSSPGPASASTLGSAPGVAPRTRLQVGISKPKIFSDDTVCYDNLSICEIRT
jgi:hypothetical protein